MKPGYSLIEITVGIFLSSLLAISLFQSVRSTTTTVKLADDLMDLDMRVAHFHHQFGNDTIGIFVPEHYTPAPAQQEAAPSLVPGQSPQPALETKSEPDKKPVKNPDRLFYSVNTETGQLSECTFITTNPVRVYEKATNVTKKPRMVRVMYRLVADPKHPESFTLFRQESEELDASALSSKTEKPVRSYALLGNIKKMNLTFSYPVKREETEQKPAPAPGQKGAVQPQAQSDALPEIEKILTRSDWPFKTPEEAREKKVPLSAQLITVTLELWGDDRMAERAFELQYPIASFTLAGKKPRKPKKPAPAPAPVQKTGTVQKKTITVGGKPGQTTTQRIEFTARLKPATEDKLSKLGEKVYKYTFEDTKKEVAHTPISDDDFIKQLEQIEQFLKTQKSPV